MSMTANYGDSYRSLNSAEKVAALLLVMGKPLASKLLGHFETSELKLITRSAAALGSVPIDLLEDLVEEFAGDFSNSVELRGTANEAQNLIAGVLPPEQVADIMSDVLGSSNQTTWEQIAALSTDVLSNYLTRQHPQVFALVLSKLDTGKAAALLEKLPRAARNATTRRLLGLGTVADAALRVIETRMKHELILNPPVPATAAASRMADIINKMAPEQAEDIMSSLEQDRPADAEVLRGKLFSFDDLVNLPPATRQALFEKVPSDRIVIALSVSDEAFRSNILSSLTVRARRLVENELAGVGVPPARDVAAARRMIVDMLLGMASRGEVELRAPEGE